MADVMTPEFFFDGRRVLQRVFIMYGNLSDYYVTPAHCWRSFDRAVASHLKHLGYDVVMFFNGTDKLECADAASARLRREHLRTRREIQLDKRDKERSAASAGDDVPAADPADPQKPAETPAAPKKVSIGLGSLMGGRSAPAKKDPPKADETPEKKEEPLQFAVDVEEVPDYLDMAMRCTKVKTAIIFCNCMSLINAGNDRDNRGVSMQAIARKMSLWFGLPAENSNICTMLFDVPRIVTLHDTLREQRMWNFLFERAFNGSKPTEAVVAVESPMMDEIRCLLHDTLPDYVDAASADYARQDVERAAQYCVVKNHGSLKALQMFIHQHPTDAIQALLNEYGGVQEDALKKLREKEGWENVYEAVRRILEKADMLRGEDESALPLYPDTNLRMAYARGLSPTRVNLSMILQGNPGTGKTSVVELIAKTLYQKGLLRTDIVHKVTRSDLVAGYVGQTAIKTTDAIQKAMGGVLFVDEAYSLYRKGHDSGHGSDFGMEAVETLLEAITDHKGEISIILAGYPKDMKFFLTANSGLPRRFDGNIVTIEDYKPPVLERIFLRRIEELNELSRTDSLPEDVIFELGTALMGEWHAQEVADGLGIPPKTCVDLTKADRNDKHPSPLNIFFNNWHADRDQQTFGNAGAALELADAVMEAARSRSYVTNGVIVLEPQDFGAERQKLFTNRQPSMDDLHKQLQDVIGLEQVKETLSRIVSYLQLIRAQEKHRLPGLPKAPAAEPGHYLFIGNPGTGKTMISEKLGIALSSMGLIGKYKPVRRTGLDLINTVTAPGGIEKLKEELEKYAGGVLVIDEAHQLSNPATAGGGSVVIKCLLDPMIEHAHDLCVVFCCYPHDVESLLKADAGLARRITDVFVFDDYTPEQITQIFAIKARKEGYDPDDAILELVTKAFEGMSGFLENGSSAEKMLKEIKISIGIRLRSLYSASGSLSEQVDAQPDLCGELYQILPEDVENARQRILKSMTAKRSGNPYGLF